MLKYLQIIPLLLASFAPAFAEEPGVLNPEEGGLAFLNDELRARPDMAGFRCWVVYEVQKGGMHDENVAPLQSCVAAGNAPSMILMAHAYENGLGVPKDLAAAAFWVKQAALQGYPVGQYHYGMALLTGRGVPQDEGQARFWLDRAAQAGDEDARAALQTMAIS